MSSADVQKFSQLAASMKRAFNVDVLEGSHSTSILDQSSELPIQIEAGLEDQAGLGATELDVIFSEMGWVFQEEGIEDKVTIQVRQEGCDQPFRQSLIYVR